MASSTPQVNSERISQTLALARSLQQRATQLQTPSERRQQAELDRMLQHPSDKATLVQLTDQAFRAKSARRVADQFTHILDVQGVPRFFNPVDRVLLRGFQTFGGWLPGVSVPMVQGHMQMETANVILPADLTLLAPHLKQRREQGIRMNVNFLGEAILSEAEAGRRMQQYLEAMQSPETEVFSVKISTLYSQMSPLAREHTLTVLCDRLARLYEAGRDAIFIRDDGTRVAKFLYLDMEEYRDLSLTCEVFMRTLSRPGLEQVAAGIALQAYVPDSFAWQQRLDEWARQRVASGGAAITIRLVKGANLEMERVEAAIRGWPQAPYKTKRETDANYKRMLHEGFLPENLAAVKLGVASHNLFDVAYALVLTAESRALNRVQFEMLEGMANHQRRALLERISNLLLYAPASSREHFLSAIGYLIRRLDENTGDENFLRHAFRLEPDSPTWNRLEEAFLDAFSLLPGLSDAPRRMQDRSQSQPLPSTPGFRNEPDTDWSLPRHAAWAQDIIKTWRERLAVSPAAVSVVVDGCECASGRTLRECVDPSQPGFVVAHCAQATADDVSDALTCAAADPDGWRALSPAGRTKIMKKVAQELRSARGDLMAAALAHTGKVLAESDPEVSEAIDFVEFYAQSAQWLMESLTPHVTARGKGVAVVVPPWNFPIAIPCGGIAAALAAGNAVILKPASDAVLPAWELCQCFWRGGISRRVLQFLPCSGGDVVGSLVSDPRVNAVILTGGTATALSFLRKKPGLPLTAETGGKNATIVTALADRDLAIKNVLHSAFSHGGQKCSATSLLLLEAEVYDDLEFQRALVEAASSLIVGSPWDLPTRLGPLIRPPSGDLLKALTTLEDGESWALQPGCLE
ncbi:MAG TPA: bifunctional proline dehydrogenase/L-glutamate gamma-semialdehyde dehydrogenase, partial [Verrucomicrobium sp.]|nr:bifunctional proline dehydrogenase/L-glutamate gamma-semialdehyde dehydrogenase [Verrucomicrobium sp.]